MFKKVILVVLFFSVGLCFAESASDANTQAAEPAQESTLNKFMDKSGEVISESAEKTKEFSKKAASATKKTWNDAVDGTKEFFGKYKNKDKKSCPAKTHTCQKDNKKGDCPCECKCKCSGCDKKD